MYSLTRKVITLQIPSVRRMSTKQTTTTDSSNFGKRLKGKVAVVTASTEGMGFSIAQRFAAEGASVVLGSRTPEKVDAAVESLLRSGYKNVLGVVCNVAKAEDRENLFAKTVERFGAVDILSSNAGMNTTIGGVADCKIEDFQRLFNFNVTCSLQMAQLAIPHMKERNGGAITFLSSVGGHLYIPELGVYCLSKTTLSALTKCLASDLAKFNIRVNSISPGPIQTNFLEFGLAKAFVKDLSSQHPELKGEDLIKAADKIADEGVKNIMSRFPQKRHASPEEISGIAAFLASEDASFVTGENIIASGGLH